MPRKKKVGRKPLPARTLKKNIKEQQAFYNKNKTKSYSFRFMLKRDKEVIEHLDKQENKVNYIRNLILEDMKKSGD